MNNTLHIAFPGFSTGLDLLHFLSQKKTIFEGNQNENYSNEKLLLVFNKN